MSRDLTDEERVAACELERGRDDGVVGGVACHRRDERADLRLGQPAQFDRERSAGERRGRVGPGDPHHGERQAVELAHQELEQGERLPIGPLQIVEHHHQRLRPRCFAQALDDGVEAEEPLVAGTAGGRARRVVERPRGVDAGASRRVRDLLPQSQRRLAVLGGPGPQRPLLARRVRDERRLPDARLSGHEREGAASARGAVHHPFEIRGRAFAADEGSDPDVVDAGAGVHPLDRTGPTLR